MLVNRVLLLFNISLNWFEDKGFTAGNFSTNGFFFAELSGVFDLFGFFGFCVEAGDRVDLLKPEPRSTSEVIFFLHIFSLISPFGAI